MKVIQLLPRLKLIESISVEIESAAHVFSPFDGDTHASLSKMTSTTTTLEENKCDRCLNSRT